MTTCAVTNNLLKYDINAIYTVGEHISKNLATDFIKANFAIEVEDKDEKVEKPRKRANKDE